MQMKLVTVWKLSFIKKRGTQPGLRAVFRAQLFSQKCALSPARPAQAAARGGGADREAAEDDKGALVLRNGVDNLSHGCAGKVARKSPPPPSKREGRGTQGTEVPGLGVGTLSLHCRTAPLTLRLPPQRTGLQGERGVSAGPRRLPPRSRKGMEMEPQALQSKQTRKAMLTCLFFLVPPPHAGLQSPHLLTFQKPQFGDDSSIKLCGPSASC